MFDTNLIARSHFTSKQDGLSSLHQFCKEIGVNPEKFPFECEEGMTARGKKIIFRVESWGGYFDANGNWRVFIAYRASQVKVTRWTTWLWDVDNKQAYDEVTHSFVN